MSGFLTSLAAGVGQLLESEGIGRWNEAGEFAASDVGITIDAMPDSPGHIIAITPYIVMADPALPDSVVGLRFRLRGDRDPRTVTDRQDAICDALEGIESRVLNGVYVVFMWLESDLPLPQPQDANQRLERSFTFYAQVDRPTRHRSV